MAMTTTPPDLESGPATQHHEVEPSRSSEEELNEDADETTPLVPKKWHARRADAKMLITRIRQAPLARVLIASLLTSLVTILAYRSFSGSSEIDRSHDETRERWEQEQQQHEKKVAEWKTEISSLEEQSTTLLERLGVLRNETAHQVEENERLTRENQRLTREAVKLEERAQEAEKKAVDALERWEEYTRRLKREKGERAKLNLHWTDLLGDDLCRGHDDIHYRALLGNMVPELDAVEACRDTNITINGIFYERPEWCEDVGNANVYGHWTVRNEAKCLSYWDSFKDKGCTTSGSGLRRFEATLAGFASGQSEERLCLTTPATILGKNFDKPTSCPHSRWSGTWGVWDVEDENCK